MHVYICVCVFVYIYMYVFKCVNVCVLDGKYSKSAKAGESKAMYTTMLAIRSGIVAGAGTLF